MINHLYRNTRKIAGKIKRSIIQTWDHPTVYKLQSVKEWASENNSIVLPAGNVEHTFAVSPPIFDHEGFHKPGTAPIASLTNVPYVAELHNAVVYSKSSIIKAGKSALNDTLAHPKYGAYVDMQYDKTVVKREHEKISMYHRGYPVKKLKAGIFLGGLASDAFGHWPNEFLPKLEFLEYHPSFKDFPIIVDENMPKSHFEYLEYMASNQVIRLPAKSGFHCSRLLVAPTPSFIPTELVKNHPIPLCEIAPLSPERLKFMRDRVNPKITGKSPCGPKIYLSRRSSTWRRLMNEAEIEAFMVDQGFEIVYAETMSFADQVRLFRGAKCIVAPMGSSLLNLIYSDTNVRLFILSQPGVQSWESFYGMFRHLGYDMLFVVGDDMHEYIHANYSLPVERLRQALALYS